MACIVCHVKFPKARRKYSRPDIRLSSVVQGPEVVSAVFQSVSEYNEDSRICKKCYEKLKAETHPASSGTMKRKLPVPCTEDTQRTGPTKSSNRPYFARLKKYLDTYKCKAAVSLLFQRKSFKKAIMERVLKELKKEIKSCPASLKQEPSLDNVHEFSWDKTIKEVETNSPLTYALTRALFPPIRVVQRYKHRRKTSITPEDAQKIIDKRMGIVLSVIFFTRNPFRNRFVQAFMGIGMWRQGANAKVFDTLYTYGLSQSLTTIRAHVDCLSECQDFSVLSWKSEIEDGKPYKENAKSFTFCWDNVEIEVEANHEGTDNNTHLMWGVTFAVQNRVRTNELDSTLTLTCEELPPEAFVPTAKDLQSIKNEMILVVTKILSGNLPALKGLDVSRPDHTFQKEMETRSHIVNLGVVEADPASTEGAIQIMTHLTSYIPVVDGLPLEMVCGGEGLTVECMKCAIRGQRNNGDDELKLSAIKAFPQEFHKEAILLQDIWDDFFKHKSSDEKGTLYQIKQTFPPSGLKKNMMNDFHHSWDLLKFSIEGYILICAMHMERMANISDWPESLDPTATNGPKKKWLTSLAKQIVETVWCPPSKEDFRSLEWGLSLPNGLIDHLSQDTTYMDVYPYCCGEDKDDGMVQCFSDRCRKQWIHFSCANIQSAPNGDFYCSSECANDGTWIFCYCHQRRKSPMVECALGENCKGLQKYHLSCLRVRSVCDNWYCSAQCENVNDEEDAVLNHSKQFLWEGLQLLANRQAVRSGDGPQMVKFWKWDLLRFHNRQHPEYFSITHNFLADVAGFQSERIRNDMIWNRTGNLQGRPDANMGLDLVNEVLNKDFKEMLNDSPSHKEKGHLQRCAKLRGAFGKELDQGLSEAGLINCETPIRKDRIKNHAPSLVTFTQEYAQERLFSFVPGRKHCGIENMQHSNKIQQIPELVNHIQKESMAKDRERYQDSLYSFQDSI